MPRVIAGRYELKELIGRGGMGAVWRAHDMVLDREVAIKEITLPPGLSPAEQENLYARTFREARSAARLDHPNIVTVHDVAEQDGRPWIVMQLVRARALDKVIEDEGPLPSERAALLGTHLLEALRTAHAAGVIHRDVKPGNVLLAERGAVLTDFGIASLAGEATLTRSGTIIGSPAFLAPEQAEHSRVTPASDLWSLGATLYAAVEGRPPYQRTDIWGVMAALISAEPDPPERAGALLPVLEGLLCRDPELRMTAEQVAPLLDRIAGSPGSVTVQDRRPPVGPSPAAPRDVTMPPLPARTQGERPPVRLPRWPILVPAGVFAAALVAAVIVVVTFSSGSHDDLPSGGFPSQAAGPSTPAGSSVYRGQSFRASVPSAWRRSGTGDKVTFEEPSAAQPGTALRSIKVEPLGLLTTAPKPTLEGLVPQISKSPRWPGYTQVGLTEVSYQGGAADLEFTFDGGHAKVRVFTLGGSVYMVTTASADELWTTSRPYFDAFFATFGAL